MWPPLLRIPLEGPGLLTRYARGYAALLKQDAAWWKAGQVRRLINRQALALTLPGRHLLARLTDATEQGETASLDPQTAHILPRAMKSSARSAARPMRPIA